MPLAQHLFIQKKATDPVGMQAKHMQHDVPYCKAVIQKSGAALFTS